MAEGDLAWTEAMQEGLEHYAEVDDAAEAARIAVNLAEVVPLGAGVRMEAARWLHRAGRRVEARVYARAALARAVDPEWVRQELAAFGLRLEGSRDPQRSNSHDR